MTHAAPEQHFGTKPVWKKEMKILVSDPAKTIVDILSNPWAGGGIQHVTDCLKEFFKSDHFNADLLVEYAEKLDNGAVFKRLGFLTAQTLGENHPLIAACEAAPDQRQCELTPRKGERLITHWRLFVPAGLSFKGGAE